ncbi:3' terminal RNA ribose 2'-O-methyltransferase Hen1 [Cellulomonas sp. Root485]|uniref:3' terminal RNA ribose 2'-O-methyltransferase Hen1 n=1 Tax=Cellulomonas sp. Root485 TaxID=1736546 RepID=UPI0006F8B330|nr:3' terminal RNA ribose 2'-O-methyltransferase Hen1 [Cellulomonas sp. Root485]KQY22230.1 3' terminal RNA ribose 2'-O-methyltransferase Hen1 [Cellulomonas sp. Root485]
MFLTLTSTAGSASDLGFLLHKHPDRAQTFDLSVGRAHVFYPEASDERCTVALLLEVDPVELVRGGRFGDGFALGAYVNDRPYAASSLLSVALGRVFRSAMAGTCAVRPDLVGVALPLEIHVPAVPDDGDPGLVARLFEPLGWTVDVGVGPLDPQVPSFGESPYADVRLTGTFTPADALRHLYVLLPALDGGKHYWVGPDEVDKLVRSAGEWLGGHPERDWILRRSLAHRREYVADAVERLGVVEVAEEQVAAPTDARPLSEVRREVVLAELRAARASSVIDLGCGEGALLRELLADPAFTRVVGADVSHRALRKAAERLGLDRMPDSVRARLTLLQSSVTYRDARLAGADAVVLMEVIEHVDLDRLPSLERTVFGDARPRTVVVTTPNEEFNVRYPTLHAGTMRHTDHRFEWTRAQGEQWAARMCETYGYTFRAGAVGDVDREVGPPTQLLVFTLGAAA